MGAVNWIVLLLTHPLEFRTLLQFYLYHEQKRDIKALQEHPTSGWDRESMQRCWHFLDLTSRSFAAVIKELDGDLARTIALFYLVLRGLDTIEDDMTIPDATKQPILRKFHELTVTPGWKYDGCGPDEKDRQLLVEYDLVVKELNLLEPSYKAVIIDITHKMATGMADYAHVAATSASSSSPNGSIYLSTIAEYDLYCHYVAGLVGEGLSRIFAASGKEETWLGDQLELSNSMGLLLQKTNIIRDFREDVEQGRHFWPKEIWGRYGFEDMKEMCALDEDVQTRAKWVQSHMILDALRHVTDSLDYLKLLKNQSVFNFCAIPATMAIATLSLCFSNPAMFQRNIKIRKATAAKLIMRSTNPREVASIFREYARDIHRRLEPRDPSYVKIGVCLGRIESWMERNYPTFVQVVDYSAQGGSPQVEFTTYDVRSRVFRDAQKRNLEVAKRNGLTPAQSGFNAKGLPEGFPALSDEPESASNVKAGESNELIVVVGGAIFVVLALAFGAVWVVLKFVPINEVASKVESAARASVVPKVEL